MTKLIKRIRWVATGLIIVMIAAVSLVWFSFRQSEIVGRASDWVSHTNSVLYHASSLQSYLNENQARVRDYVFTGDEKRANLIPGNERAIDSIFKKLKELTADNPAQQVRINELSKLIPKRIAFSCRQMDLYRSKGRDSVFRITASGEGIRYMDSIRNILSEIQQEESALLNSRNKATEEALLKLNWLKSGLFILMLVLIFIVLLFIGQQQKARRKIEAALKAMNTSLASQVKEKTGEITGTLERISDFFISVDKDWRLVYVNRRAGLLVSRQPDQLMGQSIWDALPRLKGSHLQEACLKAANDLQPFTTTFFAPDQERWLEVYGYPDEKGLSLFIHDFTERKQAESRLIKVNRLYYFISQINQMIVRVGSDHELFSEACDIAIKMGGFPLVWIGEPDATGPVRITYRAGNQQGYIDWLNESAALERATGKGPAKRAIRERKPVRINDLENDPDFAPWRSKAAEFGLKSIMVFPLFRYEELIGVMAFYAAETNFFDTQEIALLEEVTGDISFALGNIKSAAIRQTVELELRERNQFITTLIDTSPDIIYIYDLKKQAIVYVNREVFRGLGYTAEEMQEMGSSMLSTIMHPEDFNRYIEEVLPVYAVLPDGKINVQEFRVCDKKGDWHWFYCKEIIYKRAEDGSPEQIFGLLTDITDLKRIERDLRNSEEQYRSMVDRISDGFIALDKNWRYVYVNSQIEKMVHKPASELIGRNVWEVFPDAIGSNTYNTFMKAMEEQVYIRSVDYYPPLDLWQENHIYPSPDGLAVFIMDISQRKKAENELEQSEQKYRMLFEYSPMPLWIYSLKDFRILDVNHAALRFYGYSKEEFLKLTIADLRPPEYREQVRKAANQLYGGYHYAGIWKHLKKDGTLVDMEIVSHETIFQNEPVRLTLAMDVTSKLAAEDQLRHSLDSIRKLSDHLQTVREEERKRISREIHDELGQQLTAIKMDTVWIQRKLNGIPEPVQHKLANMISLLDSSHLAIRRILKELRMGVLAELGLADALQWQGRQFEAQTGITFRMQSTLGKEELPEPVTICIYRVVQEGLNNIAKHSKASAVEITLEQNAGKISMSIADNGIGMQVAKVSESAESFGILGMKERVLALNGTFGIGGGLAGGTEIRIEIPLR